MKHILYPLLFSMCTITVGCDGFLNEMPSTSITSGNVYNELSTAQGALNGCYATMASYDTYAFNYFHVVSSTSLLGVSIKSNDKDLASLKILPSNVNVERVYRGFFKTITAANDILQGLENTTIENETEVDRIRGEAYLIRAISYFNLVRLYGGVPLYTEVSTNYEETQKPRSSAADIYKLIHADLVSAQKLLPEVGKQQEGYPHRMAPLAIQAKVFLTQAGNSLDSPFWQDALECANEVVESKCYELVYPFSSLFGSSNKNNEESIFEVQFAAAQTGSRFTETTLPPGHPLAPNATGSNSWGKTRPTKYAFERIDSRDPRREASFIWNSYTNIFDDKEYMLYPILRGTPEAKGLKYRQGDSEYTAWSKYRDESLTTVSNCNFVYMRYADLLLIQAEAANELGQTKLALDAINAVRHRARDTNGDLVINPETEIYPLELDGSLSQNELRLLILDERLLELAGECDEWFTIRRRGVEYMTAIIEAHNENLDSYKTLPNFVYMFSNTAEDVRRNLLLPFPQDEINRNSMIGPEDQNYGY